MILYRASFYGLYLTSPTPQSSVIDSLFAFVPLPSIHLSKHRGIVSDSLSLRSLIYLDQRHFPFLPPPTRHVDLRYRRDNPYAHAQSQIMQMQRHSFTALNSTFVVDAEYQFVKELGQGAYGCVVAAKHRRTGDGCAIKKITNINTKVCCIYFIQYGVGPRVPSIRIRRYLLPLPFCLAGAKGAGRGQSKLWVASAGCRYGKHSADDDDDDDPFFSVSFRSQPHLSVIFFF